MFLYVAPSRFHSVRKMKKKKVSNLVQHIFHNTSHGMIKMLLKVSPLSSKHVNVSDRLIHFASAACSHLCVLLSRLF